MFGLLARFSPSWSRQPRVLSERERGYLLRAAQAEHRAELGHRPARRTGEMAGGELADVLFASAADPKLPDEVFPMLRWGGVFVFVGGSEARVRRLAELYTPDRGFIVERPVRPISAGTRGWRLPGMGPCGHTFTARRTRLLQAGNFTERFTYHVELTPESTAEHGYVVTKSVPTFDDLFQRLRAKFPQVPEQDLVRRTKKLIGSVFPTFLTREAAVLKILQRHLPPEHRGRVPKMLNCHMGRDGMVRRLTMTWLRVGGPALSQIAFARQSAELLRALHDEAGVIHLDLRLDNFVITPAGVGFVDFGSAVRVGENLGNSPMLYSLFSEMMRTSQIQRMLGKMLETGHVTNRAMREVHGKVDRTVDAFYLAVQIQRPHGNPELAPLINHVPDSREAKALSSLTAAILRPKNPAAAQFKTAADILRGIDRIERRLLRGDTRHKAAVA